jgi:hypothetical protein
MQRSFACNETGCAHGVLTGVRAVSFRQLGLGGRDGQLAPFTDASSGGVSCTLAYEKVVAAES